MSNRGAGAIGLLATALFWTSLAYFAAHTPGYSHATKAVSELGVDGAPHQLAWNVFGFLLPGILLAFHGWGVGAARLDRIGGALFAAAGVAFAATAVPADMSNLESPSSIAHIAASLASFAFWLIAAVKLSFGRDLLARITRWSLMLALVAAALRFSHVVFPGAGQRLAFAAYFAWVAATSLALIVTSARER